jgi:hypothetical protein
MIKATRDIKKSRGRPKTTGSGVIVGARWHGPELAEIDNWRRREDDLPSRAEAIRRLVRAGLDSLKKGPRRKE